MRRLAVLAVGVLATAGAISSADASESCASGFFVGGGSRTVTVPVGELELAVATWDAYAGREWADAAGQTHESVTVGGRSTPDLADGARADWSGSWRWASPGTLTVAHAWPGSGPHSVSWRVCWAPVADETTVPPMLPSSSTTTVPLEPDAPPVTDTPPPDPLVEVLPEAVVPDPVVVAPTYTG